MSIEPVLSIVRHHVFDSIEEQVPRLEKASRRRVVLCCDEQCGQGWARRLDDAVMLAGKGAETEDADVQEAVRFAIDAYDVEEVLVVIHTECAHRERPRRSSRVALTPSSCCTTAIVVLSIRVTLIKRR